MMQRMPALAQRVRAFSLAYPSPAQWNDDAEAAHRKFSRLEAAFMRALASGAISHDEARAFASQLRRFYAPAYTRWFA